MEKKESPDQFLLSYSLPSNKIVPRTENQNINKEFTEYSSYPVKMKILGIPFKKQERNSEEKFIQFLFSHEISTIFNNRKKRKRNTFLHLFLSIYVVFILLTFQCGRRISFFHPSSGISLLAPLSTNTFLFHSRSKNSFVFRLGQEAFSCGGTRRAVLRR